MKTMNDTKSRIRKLAADKEWTGAAIGAGLGGLAGVLLKKYISGDRPTNLVDYLLWGGGGAALGGGIGYGLGSIDHKTYTKPEIAKLEKEIKKGEEQLAELKEEAKIPDLLSSFGIPSLTTGTGIVTTWLGGKLGKGELENLNKRIGDISSSIDKTEIDVSSTKGKIRDLTDLIASKESLRKSWQNRIDFLTKKIKDNNARLFPDPAYNAARQKWIDFANEKLKGIYKLDSKLDGLQDSVRDLNTNLGAMKALRKNLRLKRFGLGIARRGLGVALTLGGIGSGILNSRDWRDNGVLFNPAKWDAITYQRKLERARENMAKIQAKRDK